MEIRHDHDNKEVHVEGVDITWGLLGCKPGIVYSVFLNGKHVGSGMRKEMKHSVSGEEALIELEYRPIDPLAHINITVELD